jgi:hypothetical protein
VAAGTDGSNAAGVPGPGDAGGRGDLVEFWRTPVFNEKLHRVPAFLLPRLAEMAAEVPRTDRGRRIYYERIHCLLVLAHIARRTDPAAFDLAELPTEAERRLGGALGQAFHQGCSLADVAFATGLPAERVVAIGKRTIRRAGWLSRIAADEGLPS